MLQFNSIQFNSVSASHVLHGTLHTTKNSEDEQVWPLFLANSKFSVDRWGAQLNGRAFTQHIQNPGRGPPPRRWRGIMDIIAYIFDMYRNYLFICVKQVCICDIKVFLFRIIPLCLIKGFFFFAFAFLESCLSNLQLQSVQRAVISSKSLLRPSSYWNLNN